MNQWPKIRDVVLFAAGLAGVAHETLVAASDRPTLLILFAAMMGLPAFLQKQDAPQPPPAPAPLPSSAEESA